MPRTAYKASKVKLGNKEHTVKFNKTVQHSDDIPKPDAIRDSVNKKLSKLECKVIGITSMGYNGDTHTYLFHLGNKDDNIWQKLGEMTVSFS